MGVALCSCVAQLALPKSHLYLWVPNALVLEGLEVMKRWGFTYKTNLVWYKIRKGGGLDGRGVGFYFPRARKADRYQPRSAPGVSLSNCTSARERRQASRRCLIVASWPTSLGS